MSPHETVGVESSIERVTWVRALARALVADEHEAEDLAQEAWLAALKAGPTRRGAWKGWFGAVLRNLARARFRGEHRRRAREDDCARPDEVPAADELADRLETHERLVRAVRELDEPYRGTLALRYFEGLTPQRIAERTGVPLRTVETRLHRALQRLRERLDAQHRGDRGAWLALLVPLTRPHDAALAGALIVQTKLKLGVAAAALLAVLWVVRERVASDARVGATDPNVNSAVLSSDSTEAPALAEPATTARVAAEPPAAEPLAGAASEPAAAWTMRGVVVDPHGRPLADLRVVLRDETSRERLDGVESLTDTSGAFRFELARPFAPVELDVASAIWTVVLRPRPSSESVIVVAPRRSLAGVVVDEGGRPIEGAEVDLRLPPELRSGIPLVLAGCQNVLWSARADAAGLFEFVDAPDLPGCALGAGFAGFEPSSTALEDGDRLDLRIVLKRHANGGRLLGRVVDVRGAPIESAFVTFEDLAGADLVPYEAVKTNARGEFDLSLEALRSDARKLRALKAGYQPAELECATAAPSDADAWPRPLELVLREGALSIAGVVLDADGKPLSDVHVDNLDTTRFGNVPIDFDGTPLLMTEDIETVLAGAQFSTAVSTDELGRFELRGLLPKSYRLRAFAWRTMELVETAPIEAGRRDVEIRLPREPRIPRIAGKVQGANGDALAGVRVMLVRDGPQRASTSARWHDTELAGGARSTGDDGRFEFLDVPRGVRAVRADLSDLGTTSEVELAEVANPEELVLVIARTCHLKIELTGSAATATSFSIVDAQGALLDIALTRGNTSSVGKRFGIQAPGTEALSVPETASELVLEGPDGQVVRVALKLVPGELTIVRP